MLTAHVACTHQRGGGRKVERMLIRDKGITAIFELCFTCNYVYMYTEQSGTTYVELHIDLQCTHRHLRLGCQHQWC